VPCDDDSLSRRLVVTRPRYQPCWLSAPERTGANAAPSTSWGSLVRAQYRPSQESPASAGFETVVMDGGYSDHFTLWLQSLRELAPSEFARKDLERGGLPLDELFKVAFIVH
jgi:hypothetical protein